MEQEELKIIESKLRLSGKYFKGISKQIESLIATMHNLNDSLNKLKEFRKMDKRKM